MTDLIFTLFSCRALTLFTKKAEILLLFFPYNLVTIINFIFTAVANSVLLMALQTIKQQ